MSEDAYQESRSAPKLLLLKEDAIKTSRNQEPGDQDTKTRQGGSACFALLCFALLCLLAWTDLAWKDGRKLCLDWIGNSVQDS